VNVAGFVENVSERKLLVENVEFGYQNTAKGHGMSHLGARFASESASFDPMTGFFNKQEALSVTSPIRYRTYQQLAPCDSTSD